MIRIIPLANASSLFRILPWQITPGFELAVISSTGISSSVDLLPGSRPDVAPRYLEGLIDESCSLADGCP